VASNLHNQVQVHSSLFFCRCWTSDKVKWNNWKPWFRHEFEKKWNNLWFFHLKFLIVRYVLRFRNFATYDLNYDTLENIRKLIIAFWSELEYKNGEIENMGEMMSGNYYGNSVEKNRIKQCVCNFEVRKMLIKIHFADIEWDFSQSTIKWCFTGKYFGKFE
jgi:hypothetical protein